MLLQSLLSVCLPAICNCRLLLYMFRIGLKKQTLKEAVNGMHSHLVQYLPWPCFCLFCRYASCKQVLALWNRWEHSPKLTKADISESLGNAVHTGVTSFSDQLPFFPLQGMTGFEKGSVTWKEVAVTDLTVWAVLCIEQWYRIHHLFWEKWLAYLQEPPTVQDNYSLGGCLPPWTPPVHPLSIKCFNPLLCPAPHQLGWYGCPH